jgi:hypothetical protein
LMIDLLKSSEDDRAARLEQIHTLTRRVQESEEDGAARLAQIHTLTHRLREMEKNRAADAAAMNSIRMVGRRLLRLLRQRMGG